MIFPRPQRVPVGSVAWQGCLNLEREGQTRLTLRAGENPDVCTLEVPDRAALTELLGLARTAGRAFTAWKPPTQGALARLDLGRLAARLPSRVELRLAGFSVGHFEPAAPLNTWARAAGLPFGRLTLHQLALARAWLR